MPRQNGLFSSLKDSITSGLSAFTNAARNKTMEPSRNLLAQRAETIPTSVYRAEPAKKPTGSTMMSGLPSAVRSVTEQALQKPVPEMLQAGRERLKELEEQGPTPTRPGVPINARGAGMTFPSVAPQPPQAPQFMYPSFEERTQFQVRKEPTLRLPTQQGMVPSITPEQYNQLSPEQQLQYRRAAQQQELRQAREMSEAPFREVEDRAQEREDALRAQISELQGGKLTAAQQEQFGTFKADLDAAEAKAIARAQETAARRKDQLNESLSFSGFGRSTKRAELLETINQDLQNSIADIERSSAHQLSDVKVQMLAQNESKVARLEDQLTRTQSQRDQYALQQALDYKNSVETILKQNPTSPQSVIAAADKLKAAQIEERKQMKQEAVDNFRWMTSNFGSQFVSKMSEAEIGNYARNLGVPKSVLQNMGATLKEVDRAWDQAKYLNDFQYQMNHHQAQRDHDLLLYDRKFRDDLLKMGIQFKYDKKALYLGEQIKNEQAAKKYQNLYNDDYSARASAADGQSLYFPEGTTHSSANVTVKAINPKLVNAYPQGTKKMPADGPKGLGGQCAWEARKWTDLTPVGNSFSEKKAHLKKWKQQGRGWEKGEFTVNDLRPGQTVLTNDSPKHGHVAVINAITDDGKMVLSEFNQGGKLTYTNHRVLSPDDPSLVGIWDSKLKKDFQVAPTTQALDKGKGVTPMYAERELVRSGRASKELQSDLLQRFKEEADETRNLGLPNAASYQERYETLLEDMQKSTPINSDTEKAVTELRKEVYKLPVAKDLEDINRSYKTLQSVYDTYKQGDTDVATTDQALVVAFQKMLDPGSVVREGEFDRTAQGQALLGRAQSYLGKLQAGGVGITDKMRQDMVTVAAKIQEGYMNDFKSQASFYIDEAERLGVPPERVLGVLGTYEGVLPPTGSAPPEGFRGILSTLSQFNPFKTGYSMPDETSGTTSQSFYSADDF